MSTHHHSSTKAMCARVQRLWSEIGYANHRMFAIRTGERLPDARPVTKRRGQGHSRRAATG